MTFDLTLNAKRMSTESIVRSFVVPETFEQLTTNDHAFLIGPRGSGKTTLLKMLSCRFQAVWDQVDPLESHKYSYRQGFTGIFLPTDSLWTTQTHESSRTLAFSCQLLSRLLDGMQFRAGLDASSGYRDERFPAVLTPREEVNLVQELAEAWALIPQSWTLRSLSRMLDHILVSTSEPGRDTRIGSDPFAMAALAVKAFNDSVGQPDHRWGLLMDELEIAPPQVVEQVMTLVRGGPSEIVVKASMSPSDLTQSSALINRVGRPMPGHDFVPVHLLSQSSSGKRNFTQVLWHQSLASAGVDPVSIESSFGRSFQDYAREEEGALDPIRSEFELSMSWDKSFSEWYSHRGLDVNEFKTMTYTRRSAVVRKVYPLLVFRNGTYKLANQPTGWARRSRKKEFEPFSGAPQIINALEGNPRWIKSAFRVMVDRLHGPHGQVDSPAQFSALLDVAQAFESFLRFLPAPKSDGRVRNDLSLIQFIDHIAKAMHGAHVGKFSPDPPNSFVVDGEAVDRFGPIIELGLYSGGLVHVRGGSSSPILTDFEDQRFRLTYLLAVRPDLSFPLRLGRPLALSRLFPTETPVARRGYESDHGQAELPLGLA